MKTKRSISNEVLASYLDGCATAEECREVLDALHKDGELREILKLSQLVDADLGLGVDDVEVLPISAVAANSVNSCTCSPECEKYILRGRSIEFDEQTISERGRVNHWQIDAGTALHNIGRHLESYGLAVVRRYKCSMADIVEALNTGRDVIAVVDGGELIPIEAFSDESLSKSEIYRYAEEYIEDLFIGEIPDHCVVVKSCDVVNQTITLYDPNREGGELVSRIPHFIDAWQDSKCYLVMACDAEEYVYEPQPIDLSDVELDKNLDELREAIAENAHEVWAQSRKSDGWSYGPQRDDKLKQTPCMVPYAQLPDSEKQYDRDMAMQTIKLMRKLGYDFVRTYGSGKNTTCKKCGECVDASHRYCHSCGEKLK